MHLSNRPGMGPELLLDVGAQKDTIVEHHPEKHQETDDHRGGRHEARGPRRAHQPALDELANLVGAIRVAEARDAAAALDAFIAEHEDASVEVRALRLRSRTQARWRPARALRRVSVVSRPDDDLPADVAAPTELELMAYYDGELSAERARQVERWLEAEEAALDDTYGQILKDIAQARGLAQNQIGRASCRERVSSPV